MGIVFFFPGVQVGDKNLAFAHCHQRHRFRLSISIQRVGVSSPEMVAFGTVSAVTIEQHRKGCSNNHMYVGLTQWKKLKCEFDKPREVSIAAWRIIVAHTNHGYLAPYSVL